MRLSVFISFAAGVLIASTSHATYWVSTTTGQQIQFNKRTHIVFSGRGNDLGTAPQFASVAKAAKILAANPSDQIVLININSRDRAGGESILRRYNFGSIAYSAGTLDSTKLMDIMTKFPQIASFHAYGHSGIIPGIYLDGVGNSDLKWTALDPQSQRLVGHFTPDAYATLNGCNAGHLQAPVLSRLWQIPVAATLTSTHFETEYQDGSFYWMNEARDRAILAPDYITQIRMRPDNNNYHGHLGKYSQGIPFFKFFCAGVPEATCLSGMANSMRSVVSSTELPERPTPAQYGAIVREYLCPSGQNMGETTQQNCMATLARMSPTPTAAERTYSPFSGHLAHCDFNGCYANPCAASAAATSACASASPTERAPSTSFVDEYTTYLKAFSYVSVGTVRN